MVVAAVLAMGACSPNEERRGSGSQPAPGTETFEQGLFDEIPHFPRSEPLGPRSEESDVVAQSFRARDATPEQVMEYYRASLDDWDVVTPPRPPGENPDTLRGKWSRDQWILIISASPAPAVGEPPEAARVEYSQYSLSLEPV